MSAIIIVVSHITLVKCNFFCYSFVAMQKNLYIILAYPAVCHINCLQCLLKYVDGENLDLLVSFDANSKKTQKEKGFDLIFGSLGIT